VNEKQKPSLEDIQRVIDKLNQKGGSKESDKPTERDEEMRRRAEEALKKDLNQ